MLKQRIISLLVFILLYILLLSLMVINQLISFSVFLFKLMINAKQLFFCLKLFTHFNIIISSEVYKPVTLWNTILNPVSTFWFTKWSSSCFKFWVHDTNLIMIIFNAKLIVIHFRIHFKCVSLQQILLTKINIEFG